MNDCLKEETVNISCGMYTKHLAFFRTIRTHLFKTIYFFGWS